MRISTFPAVVRLATAGKVEILKKAQVVAQIRVNDLIVDGGVKGDVTALGIVKVGKKGSIHGDVSCRRLAVDVGAQLQGFFRVEPDFVPQHADPDAEDDFDDEFA